jgi:hypothetical protein
LAVCLEEEVVIAVLGNALSVQIIITALEEIDVEGTAVNHMCVTTIMILQTTASQIIANGYRSTWITKYLIR